MEEISADLIEKIDNDIKTKMAEEQTQTTADFDAKVAAEVEKRLKEAEEAKLKEAEEAKKVEDAKKVEAEKEAALQEKFSKLEAELASTKKELESVSLRKSVPNIPSEPAKKEMTDAEKIEANKAWVAQRLGLNSLYFYFSTEKFINGVINYNFIRLNDASYERVIIIWQ